MSDSRFDDLFPPDEAELTPPESEVVRITSADLDGDDEELDEAREHGSTRQQQREEQAKENFWFALISGNILLHKGVARYYSHLVLVIVLTIVSIFVMFWSLRVDMKHTALVSEVQLLRERSVRMRESRYSQSSHSAVVRELKRRNIDLQDARTPSVIIE